MTPTLEGAGERPITRRHVLGVLGTASAAALAGCEGLTKHSFDASSVGLSSSAQESLQLGELARDELSLERSVADGNVSVSITSHTAVYSRAAGLGGM